MVIWLASGNKHKQQELAAILTGHTIKLPAEAGITGFDPEETGKTFAENALIKARALYHILDSAGISAKPGQTAAPVLADDSGLCVDALGGRPGIYSARYYGKESWAGDGSFREKTPKLTDKERNLLLLEEINNPKSSPNNHLTKAQRHKENVRLCKINFTLRASAICKMAMPPCDKIERDFFAERKCRFVCAMVLFFSPERFYLVQETLEGTIVSSAEEIRGSGGFGYDPIVYVPELGRTVAELTEEEKNNASHRSKAGKIIAKLLPGD